MNFIIQTCFLLSSFHLFIFFFLQFYNDFKMDFILIFCIEYIIHEISMEKTYNRKKTKNISVESHMIKTRVIELK